MTTTSPVSPGLAARVVPSGFRTTTSTTIVSIDVCMPPWCSHSDAISITSRQPYVSKAGPNLANGEAYLSPIWGRFTVLSPENRSIQYIEGADDNATVDLRRLFMMGLDVLGSTMGTRAELVALLDLCAGEGIRPVIDSKYGFTAVADAFARLASGEIFGKVAVDFLH